MNDQETKEAAWEESRKRRNDHRDDYSVAVQHEKHQFYRGWNAAAEHYAPQLERLARLEVMLESAKSVQFPLPDGDGDLGYYFASVNRYVNNPYRDYFGKWSTRDTDYIFDTALEAFESIKDDRIKPLAYLDKEGEKVNESQVIKNERN
jgi:hypothetical protein